MTFIIYLVNVLKRLNPHNNYGDFAMESSNDDYKVITWQFHCNVTWRLAARLQTQSLLNQVTK